MTLAAAIVDLADLYRPKAIFVDGGAGGGVVDRLRFLGLSMTCNLALRPIA